MKNKSLKQLKKELHDISMWEKNDDWKFGNLDLVVNEILKMAIKESYELGLYEIYALNDIETVLKIINERYEL